MRTGVLAGAAPITLILLSCNAVIAAAPSAAPATPASGVASEQELDEILVEGRKPLRKPQKVIDWMARLVGRFVVDGNVRLLGDGAPSDPLEVQGRANCTGFGPAPAVHCELKIRWPETRGSSGEALLGGVSALDPANILYGFEPDRIGIRYMLVDSKGIAEGALGYLLDEETLVSRAKCVNVPGNCERIARIIASPDLKQVEMRIDLEVELKHTASFSFVMHRVPGSPSVVFPGAK
jgi:hypothetical protein